MKAFKRVASVLVSGFALTFATASFAQFGFQSDITFRPDGMENVAFPSTNCTGFYKTPNFNCEKITVPAYLTRAKDGSQKALVILSGNAGGMDKRHADYAKFLSENNINAIIIDSFRGRGHSGGVMTNLSAYGAKGLNGFNMGIDALTASSHFGSLPEWSNAKIGYLGESMSGSAAINVTRPYITRIVKEQRGTVREYDAVAALYPACLERATFESFKPIPFLLVQPEKDEITLARHCKRQVEWMNGRGGKAQYVEIAGEHHDFDGPWRLTVFNTQNTSKCAFLNDGKTYKLDDTGEEFPSTYEGYNALNAKCISRGFTSGNRGTPRLGYEIWGDWFKRHLTTL